MAYVRCLLLVAIALSGPASCRTAGTGDPGGGEEPGFHRHAANLFLGGSFTRVDEGGFTIRLDYEYLIIEEVGVGAFADFVFGDVWDRAFGLGVSFHPAEALTVVVMPGVAHAKRDDGWDPIVRVGGTYEFELGQGLVVGPAAYYDFTPDDNVLVIGAILGYRF